MKVRWEDLIARARGLGTHLLGPEDVAALARAPDLAALADALRTFGYLVPEAGATPEGLELAVRRTAAERLAILSRWAGVRTAVIAVIYEDEDRRSLRAILRGAVQGAPPEERLGGLLPTPSLPERALAELARQPRPSLVAALLRAWGNPYGPALLPDATSAQPDLLRLELLLNRTFAARAVRAALRSRNRELVAFVRETLDLENACTALILAAGGQEVAAKEAFLEGGRRLSIATFVEAAGAGDPGEGARLLAAVFRPDAVAGAFERAATDPSSLEEALLRARIRKLAARARVDPLTPAGVLGYMLRLRAEVLDVRRVIWGLVLETPRAALAPPLTV